MRRGDVQGEHDHVEPCVAEFFFRRIRWWSDRGWHCTRGIGGCQCINPRGCGSIGYAVELSYWCDIARFVNGSAHDYNFFGFHKCLWIFCSRNGKGGQWADCNQGDGVCRIFFENAENFIDRGAIGWREQFGLKYWLSMGGADGGRRKQCCSGRGVKEVGPGIRRTGVVWML